MKKKLLISIFVILVILLIIPLLAVNFAEGHDGMGIMMILFFVINPITTACLNFMVNNEIKKMWWLPVLFSILFLLTSWLVLKQVIYELIIYAVIYLFIGFIAMFIANALHNRRLK